MDNKNEPTWEEIDETLDMMAMGGLDPNPPNVSVDVAAMLKYAKDNGKEIEDLTVEETSQFIRENN